MEKLQLPILACMLGLIMCLQMNLVSGSGWDYGAHGPSTWAHKYYYQCGGYMQSPIDVNTRQARSARLDPLEFIGWDQPPLSLTLKNNGHAAQVNVADGPQVRGGDLPGTFQVEQFHFHWGSRDSQGSEHTINHKAYPLEMHIVMFNTDFPDVETAVWFSEPYALAVFSVLFEVGGSGGSSEESSSGESFSPLDKVFGNLHHVKHEGQEYRIPNFPLDDLLPIDKQSFYRYAGSLTTPYCDEVVTWTIFMDPLTVSARDLKGFRALKGHGGHHLSDNFRPTQPLNRRTVVKSY